MSLYLTVMAENFYKKIESSFFYKTTKVVAAAGTVGGAAIAITGTLIGDSDLTKWGMYIGIPSTCYLIGILAEEELFEKVSDLEKKTKI